MAPLKHFIGSQSGFQKDHKQVLLKLNELKSLGTQ